MELFEAGKANRNHRVFPEEAELKLREKFPSNEESWLTVKQVKMDNIISIVLYELLLQIKSLFSRLAAPDRVETTEDELVSEYENAEAETIVNTTLMSAKSFTVKRKPKK